MRNSKRLAPRGTGTKLVGNPSFCQSCESRPRLRDSRTSGSGPRQSRSLRLLRSIPPGITSFTSITVFLPLIPVLLRLAPAPLDCHDASTSQSAHRLLCYQTTAQIWHHHPPGTRSRYPKSVRRGLSSIWMSSVRKKATFSTRRMPKAASRPPPTAAPSSSHSRATT